MERGKGLEAPSPELSAFRHLGRATMGSGFRGLGFRV